MSRIYTGADQLIGHTPLLELTHIEKKAGAERPNPRQAGIFQPRRFREGSDREGDD